MIICSRGWKNIIINLGRNFFKIKRNFFSDKNKNFPLTNLAKRNFKKDIPEMNSEVRCEVQDKMVGLA